MKKVEKLSIREAVKHFDVSRPTLQKALKSGKVSGVQDGQGTWTIDPAELARIYQPRKPPPGNVGKSLPDNFSTENTLLPSQLEALRQQLAEAERRAAVAEALADERGKHIEDLRRMLPPPVAPPSRRSWWRWSR